MPSTPAARSKTAALARIVDCVPRGYTRAISGRIAAPKALQLAQKFHDRYGVGCTPAQRLTRKGKGLANTLLAMYWAEGAEWVEWVLLATEGGGVEGEAWRPLEAKPRLQYLGYELVRHNESRGVRWTWRRPKEAMAEAHAVIRDQANRHRWDDLGAYLQALANQPGFHGVRAQTWQLCQEALKRGYSGPLPHLYYVQKVTHGERLELA